MAMSIGLNAGLDGRFNIGIITACTPLRSMTDIQSSKQGELPSSENLEPEFILDNEPQSELALEALSDRWEYLRAHPLNLNTAHRSELLLLPGIKTLWVDDLLRERKQKGAFFSLSEAFEAASIPEFVWQAWFPYVTLGPLPKRLATRLRTPSVWWSDSDWSLSTTMRSALIDADAPNSPYGEPTGVHHRMRWTSPWVSFGLHLNADPGPRLSRGSLMASSVSLKNLRLRSTPFSTEPIEAQLLLGTYLIGYGMGLSMGDARVMPSGDQLLNAPYSGFKQRSYIGSSYSLPHRGISLSIGDTLRWSVWGSDRSYLDPYDGEEDPIAQDRIGRNRLPWADQEPTSASASGGGSTLRLQMLGTRLEVHHLRFEFGLAYWSARLIPSDSVLALEAATLRGTIASRYTALRMFSLDAAANLPFAQLQMEAASDRNGNPAGLLHLESKEFGGLSWLSQLRYFSAGFASPFGKTYARWGGLPGNERGLYVGWQYRPHRDWRWLSFGDFYTTRYPRKGALYPQQGVMYGAALEWSPSHARLLLKARQRRESEEALLQDTYGRSYTGLAENLYTMLEARLEGRLSPSLSGTLRLALVRDQHQQGRFIAQEVRWQPHKTLRLQGRVATYHTPSGGPPLYLYEPDPVSRGRSVRLSGQGIRQYLLLHYHPKHWVTLQFKWMDQELPLEYFLPNKGHLQQWSLRLELKDPIK